MMLHLLLPAGLDQLVYHHYAVVRGGRCGDDKTTMVGVEQIPSGDGARFCKVVKEATRASFEVVAMSIGIFQR